MSFQEELLKVRWHLLAPGSRLAQPEEPWNGRVQLLERSRRRAEGRGRTPGDHGHLLPVCLATLRRLVAAHLGDGTFQLSSQAPSFEVEPLDELLLLFTLVAQIPRGDV